MFQMENKKKIANIIYGGVVFNSAIVSYEENNDDNIIIEKINKMGYSIHNEKNLS